MKKALVIMAAGLGSRFGGLKQLAKFTKKNLTLLDFAILDAIQAGFTKVIFIIREDIKELFKATVSGKYEDKVEICYAYQELNKLPSGYSPNPQRTKPWGTGHAILCAKDFITEPFLVINADDYYGKSSYKLVSNFISQSKNSALLLSFMLKNTLSPTGGVSRGVCKVSPNSLLESIQEHYSIHQQGDIILDQDSKILPPETPVSMNFWAFNPSFINILQEYFEAFLSKNHSDLKAEFYLPSAVDSALKANRLSVEVLLSPEIWQGITYLEDKPHVDSFFEKLEQV